MSVAILDIDGTLVDTNYQHALAWYRAFDSQGIVLPVWRIHRHIGMGGDQLVSALTDESTDNDRGDEIRAAEHERYMEMINEVCPMEGSHELIEDLHRRGHTVLLASSAKADEVDRYVELLEVDGLVDGCTNAEDVDATKPAPDLVEVALERAGADAGEAVMVGDSPWDVKAAARAGVQTLAVMTGGFSEKELRDAGAAEVFESVTQLQAELDRTPLR